MKGGKATAGTTPWSGPPSRLEIRVGLPDKSFIAAQAEPDVSRHIGDRNQTVAEPRRTYSAWSSPNERLSNKHCLTTFKGQVYTDARRTG